MNNCGIIPINTWNGLTNSGGGGGVSDGKVKVDALATADYLGATGSIGALRVDSTFDYVDGGNFVTLGLADNSVTTAKIVDLNVTTGKLADNSVTTLKITDANVTYAKIQNVAGVSLLGNPTGSATAVSEITLGSGLSFNGTTLEVAIGTDVQAWNSKLDVFSALADGTNGQVLSTNGAGAYSWITVSGSGNVSSALDFTTDDRLILADFSSGAKNVKQSSVLLSDVALNSDNLASLTNDATARTNLGVAIGSDVQAWNSKLDVFSALADGTNGQVLSTNGFGVYSWITVSGSGNVSSALDFTTDDRLVLVDFTSGAKNVKQSSVLLSDVALNSDNLANLTNDATARTNLGVAIGTDVQQYNALLQSISTSGIVLGALLVGTGSNAVGQLAIGTNGQVLTSNGTTAIWGSIQTLGTETAQTISDDAITYTAGKTWFVTGDADIDFDTKVDETTIPSGGTIEIAFTASGANRAVDFTTNYTNNLGNSVTVPSGRTAHFILKNLNGTYHCLLNDIS